ncbi:transposable element gene [Prunus dulcis]|uniref:Transposable element protein n=1 Tax=Prunus dulcis TaxID=3755 RepID=A0A4Y1RGA0_PRUDU|nr:transposable element gene [Prunus dulcis]
MKALEKNQTWTLEILPPRKRTVGCRWVFTATHNADGSIEQYKARLVAKGYTQTYDIDYEETFAHVAKLNIVKVLLFLAANLDWSLYQFDVKNAFLHGELTEVYMGVPPGYTTSTQTSMACKL